MFVSPPGYRIVRKLGEGGFGDVYEALQLSLQRKVAIKRLRFRMADLSADMAERFSREAIALAALSGHPNVIQVHDVVNDTESHPCIIMELVQGMSLGDMMTRGQALTIPQTLNLVIQAARGLQAAHSIGIVHRDVKPDNLMLTRNNLVKVVDFGLAHLVNATHVITSVHAIVGTPWYMAPEQWDGAAIIDPRTDLYALSVILYHLTTGRLPFEASSAPALGYLHVHTEPLSPRHYKPEIDSKLEAVILKGLRKQLHQRFQNGQEMIDALEAIHPSTMDTVSKALPWAAPRAPLVFSRKNMMVAPNPTPKASSVEPTVADDEPYIPGGGGANPMNTPSFIAPPIQLKGPPTVQVPPPAPQQGPQRVPSSAPPPVHVRPGMAPVPPSPPPVLPLGRQNIASVPPSPVTVRQPMTNSFGVSSPSKPQPIVPPAPPSTPAVVDSPPVPGVELPPIHQRATQKDMRAGKELGSVDFHVGNSAPPAVEVPTSLPAPPPGLNGRSHIGQISRLAATETNPSRIGDRRVVQVAPGLALAFRWCPPGTFAMGSPADESERHEDEEPVTHVTFEDGFWMGETPITQRQWRTVFSHNPSYFQDPSISATSEQITPWDSLPVENISWSEANTFCRAVRSMVSLPISLPTEAQWEYACRAGATSAYSFGRTVSPSDANYDARSSYEGGPTGAVVGKPTPVGKYPPNAWKLLDMHGNVREWTSSDYTLLLPGGNVTDWNTSNSSSAKVLRGGSWQDGPGSLRCANRVWRSARDREATIGFRVTMAARINPNETVPEPTGEFPVDPRHR